MLSFRRNPESTFKLITVAFVVIFYILWASYIDPPAPIEASKPSGPKVQYGKGMDKSRSADAVQLNAERLNSVGAAVRHAFGGYKSQAWGFDNIRPVSGTGVNSAYGWAGYIVEAAPRLAVMGLWEEFALCLKHLVERIDFSRPQDLVDPTVATMRYLGSLVSILEMAEAGLIDEGNITLAQRDKIMDKAMILAHKLLPAYETTSGLPFPKVDFLTGDGMPHLGAEREYAIEPSNAATVLENAGLTRLTGDPTFYMRSIQAWAPLVWNKIIEPHPGLVMGPLDIFSSHPENLQSHLDTGHGIFYEVLLKAIMLAPRDKLSKVYKRRWLQSAYAVRFNLTSRSKASKDHHMQHLYLGKWDGEWYLNEMSQEACSAAGVIMLGSKLTKKYDLLPLGKALLEGCHHIFVSSPAGLGAERWSWVSMTVSRNGTFEPTSPRAVKELNQYSYWLSDPAYRFRPNYFASLFHAWRVTGQQRYRDWAWEAFTAIDRNCKTPFGFAGRHDIMNMHADKTNSLDDIDGKMVLESLMWLWLIFADAEVVNLDDWLFTSAGYPIRRG